MCTVIENMYFKKTEGNVKMYMDTKKIFAKKQAVASNLSDCLA